jgi:hypothetical protein
VEESPGVEQIPRGEGRVQSGVHRLPRADHRRSIDVCRRSALPVVEAETGPRTRDLYPPRCDGSGVLDLWAAPTELHPVRMQVVRGRRAWGERGLAGEAGAGCRGAGVVRRPGSTPVPSGDAMRTST